jgi:hypothetical protein
LNLKYDKLSSILLQFCFNFAFNFKLRRYELDAAAVAARRSFLRALWVQAFIAQYCVQGAFTAMHTARMANAMDRWDFEELMRAVTRVIAVASTVENQLKEMGAGGDGAGAVEVGRFRLSQWNPRRNRLDLSA